MKVFNLLKALEQMVQEKAQEQPYLISIGDKAEEIAQAFEDRQKTTQDTLSELDKIVAELRKAQQERDTSELSPEAFAVFWYLQKDEVPKAKEIAQAGDGCVCTNTRTGRRSSHQEQELRRSLYKSLIDAGVEKVVEYAQNLMKMLRRAST